jgi:hypothetical protein
VSTLGRVVLLWMVPVNLLVVVWVWMGRVVFGVGGWFLLVFLLSVVPVLLVALLVTTILAFTQHGRPRSLTRLQACAQLATWVCLVLGGAFCPDFGDTPDSYTALLTRVFGRSDGLLDLSWTLTLGFAAAAVAAYVVLLGSLVLARRDAPTLLQSGQAPRGTMEA